MEAQFESENSIILEKLRRVVAESLPLEGQAFFDSLVVELGSLLNAEHVLIGFFDIEKDSVRTVSFLMNGKVVDNMEYDLEDTPCKNVVGHNSCCYSKNVAERFPRDEFLIDYNIQSYVGIPLTKSDGTSLGIISAMAENEILDPAMAETIIQLFASKTTSELERLEIKDELNKSMEHFQQVFNSAPVGLFEIDINEAYSLLETYSENELSQNFDDVLQNIHILHSNITTHSILGIDIKEDGAGAFSDSCQNLLITLFQNIKAGISNNIYSNNFTYEYSTDTNKKELSIHWIIPKDIPSQHTNLIVSLEDTTAINLLQKKYAQSQKLDAIGQLAGGVAHDFNNMLSGILGAADFITQLCPNLDPQVLELLDMIINLSNSSAELTKKLLEFSRIDDLEFENVNLNSLLTDTNTILSRTIDKKISINIIQNDQNMNVLGNKASIQNVLLNLAINAQHAMPNGGDLSIKIEKNTFADIDCSKSSFDLTSGDFAHISIEDTGTGIPKKIQDKIFEPFFSTKDVGSGTGLGLSSAFGILTKHNGAITVYSEEGKGTTFNLFFPLSSSQISKSTLKEELVKGTGHILFVDDEEANRKMSKMSLEMLGYKVTLAKDGEEAYEIFKEAPTEFALIISDMIMPVMSGKQFFYAVKEISPNCPFIISSGYSKSDDITELMQAGVNGVLNKPYRLTEFSSIINSILVPQHQASAMIQ